MSRSSYEVRVPLKEGTNTVGFPSSAQGVGGAEIQNGEIVFEAGPCHPAAFGVFRKVLVQSVRKKAPKGYKSAGVVPQGKPVLNVLVEFPK